MASQEPSPLESDLAGRSKDDYGDNYESHALDIYKLYIQMADNISARRQSANSFFLGINTAIVVFVTYVNLGNDRAPAEESLSWIVALAGMVLCYLWYRLVRSYKDMNSGKFKVVHEIEKRLPLRPYNAEWTAIGRGEDPKTYLPFTNIETLVPWVFVTLHIIAFLRSVPWVWLCNR